MLTGSEISFNERPDVRRTITNKSSDLYIGTAFAQEPVSAHAPYAATDDSRQLVVVEHCLDLVVCDVFAAASFRISGHQVPPDGTVVHPQAASRSSLHEGQGEKMRGNARERGKNQNLVKQCLFSLEER